MLRVLGAALAGCWIAACGLLPHQPQRLPDGSYRTSCDAPLTSCLEAFERICEWHGYDVISASERRHRDDLRDVPSVAITSEAQVRCKPGEPMFGGKPAPPPPAPTTTPPPAPPPAPAPVVPPPVPAPGADGGVPAGPESGHNGETMPTTAML